MPATVVRHACFHYLLPPNCIGHSHMVTIESDYLHYCPVQFHTYAFTAPIHTSCAYASSDGKLHIVQSVHYNCILAHVQCHRKSDESIIPLLLQSRLYDLCVWPTLWAMHSFSAMHISSRPILRMFIPPLTLLAPTTTTSELTV